MNSIELNIYENILQDIEVKKRVPFYGNIIPNYVIKHMHFSRLDVNVSTVDMILSPYMDMLYSLRVVYKNFNVYMATEHLSVQLKE